MRLQPPPPFSTKKRQQPITGRHQPRCCQPRLQRCGDSDSADQSVQIARPPGQRHQESSSAAHFSLYSSSSRFYFYIAAPLLAADIVKQNKPVSPAGSETPAGGDVGLGPADLSAPAPHGRVPLLRAGPGNQTLNQV